MTTIEADITAKQVTSEGRLGFLPEHFGSDMIVFESLVYAYASQLSPNYKGGLWEFFELSNGGAYMAPSSQDSLDISVDGNGFSDTVGADAAGVIVCLFALCDLANRTQRMKHTALYHQLRDFAAQHEQSRLIFAAID